MTSTQLRLLAGAQALVGVPASFVCPPLSAAMMAGCVTALKLAKAEDARETNRACAKVFRDNPHLIRSVVLGGANRTDLEP